MQLLSLPSDGDDIVKLVLANHDVCESKTAQATLRGVSENSVQSLRRLLVAALSLQKNGRFPEKMAEKAAPRTTRR